MRRFLPFSVRVLTLCVRAQVSTMSKCISMEEEREERLKEEVKFDRSIESLASQNNIAAIVSGMKLHATHAGIQEKACEAFQDLSAASDDNKVLIAKEGGIPLILAALDNHAKHAGVVENACLALCSIGWSDKTVQKSIKDAGAEKLVRAAVGWSDATAKTKEYGQELLDKLAKL